MTRLKKAGVIICLNRKVTKITQDGVVCEDGSAITCDAVINASGLTAKKDLADSLVSGTNIPVYVIGDCVEARKIYDAVHGAWQAVMEISAS